MENAQPAAEAAIPKTWLTADRLLEDSFRLGNLIVESGFVPTHIVGIWRGGAPVGIDRKSVV